MHLLELLYTHIFIRYTVGFRRKALKFCSRVIWGNWELPRDLFDAKQLKFQIEISVYFPIHRNPPYVYNSARLTYSMAYTRQGPGPTTTIMRPLNFRASSFIAQKNDRSHTFALPFEHLKSQLRPQRSAVTRGNGAKFSKLLPVSLKRLLFISQLFPCHLQTLGDHEVSKLLWEFMYVISSESFFDPRLHCVQSLKKAP